MIALYTVNYRPTDMSSHTQDRQADVVQFPSVNDHARLRNVKRIKSVMDNKLFYLLDGLTTDVTDALFEEMRGMDEQDAIASHFNIMRVLKVEAGTYRQEFGDFLERSWSNFVSGKDLPSVSEAEGKAGNLLQMYSRKHQNHYKILLEEIRLRFCNMTGQDLNFHPMLPVNFYLSFWHATRSLSLNNDERLLVMSMFHRFVMDRFGQVLAVVNDRMKALGIGAIKA
ncbi:MAG: hypothetical protein WD356_00980 [Pseudomonadales bacterium]